MVAFGPCIILIQPNSVCVIQVITWIHIKSFEQTQLIAIKLLAVLQIRIVHYLLIRYHNHYDVFF